MPADTFPLAPLLDQLKSEIRGSRLQTMRAADAELLGLYWHIGSLILAQRQAQGLGAKVIDQPGA